MTTINKDGGKQFDGSASSSSQPPGLPQEILDQMPDPCGVVRIRNILIGAVDCVNGASSKQTLIAISRYEAKLLARHRSDLCD